MQQQINLYRYLKLPPKYFLTLENILILYGLYIVLLFINTTFELSKKNQLSEQANSVNIELRDQTDYLNKVKAQYPSVNLSDLQGTMRRLKEELSSKGDIAAMLSKQTSFTNYFTALSAATIYGVWLTEIEITRSGLSVTLKGMTIKSILLQKYIDQLHKQPIFSKADIKLQEINQNPNPDNQNTNSYVNFIITANVGGSI